MIEQSIDARVQEHIAQVIQNALTASLFDSEWGIETTNRALVRLTAMETALREAADLAPNRLDLRFAIASALLAQALQTNAPFDARMNDALGVYREIYAMDTNGFAAPLMFAAYTRAIGDLDASQAMLRQLKVVHPERTQLYLRKFERIEEILSTSPTSEPATSIPTNNCHAIVVLGAGLETNGTIKTKLLGRLQQGLRLAHISTNAPIIVTGGNPRNGVTEALAMSLWFQDRGIARGRLFLEDQARDTVGNALFSCRILHRLGVTNATIVTSASHIQRAVAGFEEAALQRGMELTLANLVSPGTEEIDRMRARVGIYRDVLRTSGFWAFPGVQR